MLYSYYLKSPQSTELLSESTADYSLRGPTVYPSSQNVFTGYTTVLASVPHDTYGFITYTSQYGLGTYDRCLIEIATGDSGSESNLLYTSGTTGGHLFEYTWAASTEYWPVFLPAGTRLSFRGKINRLSFTSDYIALGMELFKARPSLFEWFGRKIYSYGLDVSNGIGTALTMSSTANTWSAWTQITASTTATHKAFHLSAFAPGDYQNVTAGHIIQLGVGAAGSETIIGHNLRPQSRDYVAWEVHGHRQTIYKTVPAGSRLAVRVMSTTGGLSQISAYVNGIS